MNLFVLLYIIFLKSGDIVPQTYIFDSNESCHQAGLHMADSLNKDDKVLDGRWECFEVDQPNKKEGSI